MRAQSPSVVKPVVLILFAMVILLPLYVPLLNSFKTMEGFFSSPFSMPDKLEFKNYAQAWIKGKLFRFLINSIIVTSTAVLLVIFLSSMVAFVLSRRKALRALNRVLFVFFLMGIMIPPQVGIIPLYLQMKALHLSNTLLGLIVVFSAYHMSFTIFILYSFFKNIPVEIEDAAIIDGCGNFKLYARIVMPLSRSALIASVIFNGVGIWNNFIFPLVLITSTNKKTLPIGLLSFRGRWLSDYPIMFAGVIIVSVPLIITYLILQNRFVEGLAAGSLKG